MQTTFFELEYAGKKKQTRRARFLADLESVTPWAELVAVIEPHYPKGEGRGRLPIGVQRMLRMYVTQHCFGLSDEGAEDASYDSQVIRRLNGIDLAREAAPDATTLRKFRRLLEQKDLTAAVFATTNAPLAERGLMVRAGTIMDATIIAAPASTKNRDGERDPEMVSGDESEPRTTKKGKQRHFVRCAHPAARDRQRCWRPAAPLAPGGMKAHIGVDAESGLVHTVVCTAADVNDVTQAHALLSGEETEVYADAGYRGVRKREENQGLPVTWHVAMKRGKRKARPQTAWGELVQRIEQLKASIRSKVEHPFHVVKNLFRHKKTRYRGLDKNTKQLFTLFGLANLVLARKWLLGADGPIAPAVR